MARQDEPRFVGITIDQAGVASGFTGAHHTVKPALLQIGKVLALAVAAANLKRGEPRRAAGCR